MTAILAGLVGGLVGTLLAAGSTAVHSKPRTIRGKREGRSASLADIREAAKQYGGLEIYADPTWLSDMDAERIWQKAIRPSADAVH